MGSSYIYLQLLVVLDEEKDWVPPSSQCAGATTLDGSDSQSHFELQLGTYVPCKETLSLEGAETNSFRFIAGCFVTFVLSSPTVFEARRTLCM